MGKKFLLVVAGAFLVIITGAVLYFFIAFPGVGPAAEMVIEQTPEQVERGRYLANHVTVCIDCHSTRDWTKLSGPIMPGTIGKGGDLFDENAGFPGTFYARNITPYHLKEWSDGEIYRAITTGVSRDGSVLFPVMPFSSYGKMDPADVKAIIAYIRTLTPIEYDSPAGEANFPVNFILRTIPKPAEPLRRPAPSDSSAYGKYLITIAACEVCHTPSEQGTPIKELFMAGGFEFKLPTGTVRSANLTPDMDTGIGRWTRKQFIARFKTFDLPSDSIPPAPSNGYNTVMPWTMYAGMTEEDLGAIYNYLQTLAPTRHEVVKFSSIAENTPIGQ